MDKKPEQLLEWKHYLAECFDASQFLALGTAGTDGPWVNAVYFAFDKHFTLYFLSEPSTVHMRAIEKDGRVSCAVFNSTQPAEGPVVGLQIVGDASWVSPEEAESACKVYFAATPARHPVNQSNRAEEYANPNTVWRMAKIVPREIWVFDEKRFGGTRLKVSPEVLQ